jgi:hypothetical protein
MYYDTVTIQLASKPMTECPQPNTSPQPWGTFTTPVTGEFKKASRY